MGTDMGHANVSNLSELFINLLYAKGRLTIEQAIETAARRGESLHASEGEHFEEETLGLGFMDVIAFLSSRSGRDYDGPRPWTGPWVVPDWDVCKSPKGVSVGSNAKALLAQCRKVQLAYIPMNTVWEQRDLFRVCADAVQDEGHDEWAELIRQFPNVFTAHALWESEDDEYHNCENCPGGGDWWAFFDQIRWVFAPGWRKRYREVPRLSNVSH